MGWFKKQKILAILVIVTMVLSMMPVSIFAADTVKGGDQIVTFTIDQARYQKGEINVDTDVSPYIKDDRTMVPVAFVAPALGTDKAIWIPETQMVRITSGDDLIIITIGSKELTVNGKVMMMDTAAEIKDIGNGGGRTMLPISFIARALGVGYQWNNETRSVDFYGYSETFSRAGTYGPVTGTETIAGNVVVSAEGVRLQNKIIKGDLIIEASLEDGDISLDNIIVEGNVYIHGGGKVVTQGETNIKNMVVNSITTIEVGEDTIVDTITLNAAAKIIGKGTVIKGIINESKTTVTTEGTEFIIADGVEKPITKIEVEEEVDATPVNGGGGGSSSGGETPVISVTGITVLGDTTLATGDTLQLTANVEPANANNKTVTWSVINGTGGATINSTGLLTAVTEGTVTARATAMDGSGKFGELEITITAQEEDPVTPEDPEVPVTGITVAPTTSTLNVGETETIIATIYPANATNKNIVWTTDNASVATVDSSGVVLAVGDGTAIITGTTVDGNFSEVCNVTVIAPEFAGGDGTLADPFQVATPEQLNNVRDHLDKYFIQIADIDLETYLTSGAGYNDGAGWEPIGNDSEKFVGNYDGNSKTISNLEINRPEAYHVGLFGNSTGTISDLSLVDVDVKGYQYVGALIGESWGVANNVDISGSVSGSNYAIGGLVGLQLGGAGLTDCSSSGIVSVFGDNVYACAVGGLIGQMNQSQITDSYSTSQVNGKRDYTGGLVGYSWYSTIDNSFATGNVSGIYTVGGLVGDNNSMSEITNCYATGTVTSSGDYFGGLIGRNYSQIMNSYSTGLVNGEGSNKGGLIGKNENGSYINSYWDIDTSGQTTSAGGEGKTTLEMKVEGNFETWDFANIWGINPDENSGYPFLRWQGYTHIDIVNELAVSATKATAPTGISGFPTADYEFNQSQVTVEQTGNSVTISGPLETLRSYQQPGFGTGYQYVVLFVDTREDWLYDVSYNGTAFTLDPDMIYYAKYGVDTGTFVQWIKAEEAVSTPVSFTLSTAGKDDTEITINFVDTSISVTGVTLDRTELTLIEGGASGTLTETVFPADALTKL